MSIFVWFWSGGDLCNQGQAVSDEFLVTFTEEKLPSKACDPSSKLSLDAEIVCPPSQRSNLEWMITNRCLSWNDCELQWQEPKWDFQMWGGWRKGEGMGLADHQWSWGLGWLNPHAKPCTGISSSELWFGVNLVLWVSRNRSSSFPATCTSPALCFCQLSREYTEQEPGEQGWYLYNHYWR